MSVRLIKLNWSVPFQSSEIELIRTAFKVLYRKALTVLRLYNTEENFAVEEEALLEEIIGFAGQCPRDGIK